MRIIVQKYGGTSVGSPERILNVAKRIKSKLADDIKLVVVVSAMANTTNELIELASKISDNPKPRELDMLITTGERVSMSLLSMALWDLGIKSTSLTGSQSGIITDEIHTRARIIQVKAERIFKELSSGDVVIVAGFQGVSASREVTTLGRGGSDTTAVALTRALGAEICEIYTDVDGVMSIDPRLDSSHVKFEQIGYDMLLDLATLGAKVIHPRAIELARRYRIPLLIASSLNTNSGTLICENDCNSSKKGEAMERSRIEAVSGIKDVVHVSGIIENAIFAELLEYLNRSGVKILNPHYTTNKNNLKFSFIIDKKQFENVDFDQKFDSLKIDKEICAIMLSGFELAADLILLNEITDIISEDSSIIEMNSSNTGYSFYVKTLKLDNTLKKIHRRIKKAD